MPFGVCPPSLAEGRSDQLAFWWENRVGTIVGEWITRETGSKVPCSRDIESDAAIGTFDPNHLQVRRRYWKAMKMTARRRRPVKMTRRVPARVDAAINVLKQTPERLIGSEFAASWMAPGAETLGVELPGGVHLSRDVRVGVGPVFQEDDAFVLAVWWEAAEHPHLFPTFDGGFELRASGDEETELCLVGSYEPPLGALGRFADGVVGHRLVTASLDALLASAAERLVAAVSADPPPDRWAEA